VVSAVLRRSGSSDCVFHVRLRTEERAARQNRPDAHAAGVVPEQCHSPPARRVERSRSVQSGTARRRRFPHCTISAPPIKGWSSERRCPRACSLALSGHHT
jgi:hypothetical protein